MVCGLGRCDHWSPYNGTLKCGLPEIRTPHFLAAFSVSQTQHVEIIQNVTPEITDASLIPKTDSMQWYIVICTLY